MSRRSFVNTPQTSTAAKRPLARAWWRSMARRSRVVSTRSTMPRPDRSSVLLAPIWRWCWRISKSTKNPTRYRRRRNCCKSSTSKTISSPLTPSIAKKNLRGCRRGAGASDRSIKRQPTDLVPQRRGCLQKYQAAFRRSDGRSQKTQPPRNQDRGGVRCPAGGRRNRMAALRCRHRRGRTTCPDLPTGHRPVEAVARNRLLFVQSLGPRRAGRRGHPQTLGNRKQAALHPRRHPLRGASRIRRNPGIFARIRSFAYNILRFNQSDTIAQDRYAAALGGLKSLFAMNFYKER